MKTLYMFAVLAVAFVMSGCAMQQTYVASRNAQYEQNMVGATNQARTGVKLVTDPNFFENGRDCATGPQYVELEGENRSYRVNYGASQTCKGHQTKSGGTVRPEGLEGVSIEECMHYQSMNVVPPQCAKYGMPVTQGGTR